MKLESNFERRYRVVREVVETIILVAFMFLVIRLAVQKFQVQGMSMEGTFHNQELILVDQISYMYRPVERGDVIIFRSPPAAMQNGDDFIKRVIGLPGDHVVVTDGSATVNGVPLTEFYVNSANVGTAFGDQRSVDKVVPPGMYFVLGDNRAGSFDSRGWGFVPRENIKGRAMLIFWPLMQDNDGFPPNASAVFAHIPNPPSNNTSQPTNQIPGHRTQAVASFYGRIRKHLDSSGATWYNAMH